MYKFNPSILGLNFTTMSYESQKRRKKIHATKLQKE
jgi:hypothetical protein